MPKTTQPPQPVYGSGGLHVSNGNCAKNLVYLRRTLQILFFKKLRFFIRRLLKIKISTNFLPCKIYFGQLCSSSEGLIK